MQPLGLGGGQGEVRRVVACGPQVHLLILFKLYTYLLTYIVTYSMRQSRSSEANRLSASQEIPHSLWNPRVHYGIRKFPPPVFILSQIDPVHVPHIPFPEYPF